MGIEYGSWHHGHGCFWPGYRAEYIPANELPEDATYIGPCRCGHGPHAYYRTAAGRIVHAAALPVVSRPSATEPTYDELQEELAGLRSRLQELEKKLKESSETKKR